MGAFYIQISNDPISNKVRDHFDELGFNDPEHIDAPDIVAWFYPKQSFKSINKLANEEGTLFVSGTCFYKGKNYKDGLKAVLQDITQDTFNPLLLIGSYFLLFLRKDGERFFYSDPASVQNIFYHEPSGIISSSFLACIKGAVEISGKLVLNSNAITEVLVTGNLIGPETFIKDIFRYEPAIKKDLPGIQRLTADVAAPLKTDELSFEKQLDIQLDVLEQYFKDLIPVMNELGVMSGLTGGFDSRLIFLQLRKKTSNYRLYSTSREKPTIEFRCAQQLTKHYNQSILSPSHRRFDKFKADEFQKILEENFLFNDGHIRVHQLWTEEIKSKAYSNLIHDSQKIGISGVGGEQYRNGEYLIKSNYSLKEWFFFENIFRYCGDPFANKIARQNFQCNIDKKIRLLLGLDTNEKLISRFQIKRYYNEVYNPANRVLRNNIENQLYFFLSPFTDFIVSRSAYQAFNHLGRHHKFQKEMISRLAPEVAYVPMDYGYSINDTVPLKYRLIAPFKALLGLKNYFRIYRSRKKNGRLLANMEENHPFIRNYIKNVKNLRLPVSIERIEKSDLLSPLLIETGLFLEKMQDYIE